MLAKIEALVRAEGFYQVGKAESYLGTVYVAERWQDGVWKVMWIARDPLNVYLPRQRMMRAVLDIAPGTDQPSRIDAAIDAAERAQQDQARFIPVLGKKKFDAIA